MINKIFNWLKKNNWILSLLLLIVAIILLIYMAKTVPIGCNSCMQNPIKYYEKLEETECWCSNAPFRDPRQEEREKYISMPIPNFSEALVK